LLSRRLHFVIGKGGVGKTTVSVALARIAARSGRRVLLIELEPGGRAGAFLDATGPPTYDPRESPAGVWYLGVDGRQSLEEYLRLIVPVRRVLSAVFHSQIYQYFVAAAPGLKELMAVGKVWYEADRREPDGQPRWDFIVVDAPATGHGLQYLRMPRAARDAFGPGLVRREAARVEALLEDPDQTSIDLVTTAEEMPVTETIEAYGALRETLELPMGMLVVNRVHREVVEPSIVERLQAAAKDGAGNERETLQEIARCATEENAWARINRAQLERLHGAVALPTLTLPFVFTEEFGASDVARLSELLEAQWKARAPRRAHEGRGR
jgi:anion-transporting  ArsA/GET3 family ATPase